MSNLESKIRKLLESNKNKDPIKIEDDFNPEWLEYDSSQESTKDIANSISKNYNKASSTLLEEKDSVDIRLSTLERQITKVFAQFTGGAPDGSSVEQLIQLADVQVSYPVSDGQVLAYDANAGKWKANFGGSGGSINLTSVSQNIVPSTNETYDLGSSTNKWRDLYLSGSTLRLGDVEFKSTSEGDIEMKRAVTTAHGAAGERVKLKVKRMISDEAVDYNDLTNKPTGLATETYVDTKIADMVDSAPGALDTLNELAQSLGDDADFAGSVTNQLALKADITSVPVNVGDLSDVNLTGISSSQILQWDGTNWKPIDIPQGFDGDYNSLTNKPSLFDGDYNSLTNKPTLYADSDVDSHLNKSSATSGQILSWNGSDYAWVAESFDGDYNSLTNKPTLFDGDYNSLTNKPTIPSVLSDMSDVTVSGSLQFGQHLTWTGSNWQNLTPSVYNNTSVDTHLNSSSATSSQILSWNGSDYDWIDQSQGVTTLSGLTDTDTTTHAPQANDVLTWTANNTWEPQQSSSSAQMVLADLANVGNTTTMVQSSNTVFVFDDMKPETPFTGTFYANGSVFTPPYQTPADFTTGGHETDQLVLYYAPHDTSSYSGSGTAINDISGSGIGGGGTIVGTNTTFQGAGIHPNSGAFKFNGGSQGDYIEIDKSNGFTLAADFSIEIWHRWDSSLPSTPFYGSLWTNSAEDDWNTGTGNDTGFLIGVDEIRYIDSNGAERQSNWTATVASPIHNWHQIVFTVESGLGKVYIDGSHILDLAYTLPDYSTQSNGVYALGIADNLSSYRGEWNGLIGTTRVYHKTLTAAQVLQNYNADADFYAEKSYPSRVTTPGMSLNTGSGAFNVFGDGGHYAMLEHNVRNRESTVSWDIPLPHDDRWEVYFDLYIHDANDGDQVRFVFFAPNPVSSTFPADHGGMSLELDYYSGDGIRFRNASDDSIAYNGTGFLSAREIPVWISYDGNGNLSMELWRRGRVNNDPSSPDYNEVDGGISWAETLTVDISDYIGESGTHNGQPKINSTNNLYTGITAKGWTSDSYTTAIEIKNLTSFKYTPPSITHGDVITWNTTGYGQGEWVKTTPTNWDTAYGWGDHGDVGYLTNVSNQHIVNMTHHFLAGISSAYYKPEEDLSYQPVSMSQKSGFQTTTKPKYIHQFEDVEIESAITPISTDLLCSLDFGNPACFPTAQLANTAQGGQNGATCFDLSGNGADWTLHSFPGDRSAESHEPYRAGDVRVNPDKWGGVLEFTARSQKFADFLTCPGPNINLGNEFTIEAWIQESRRDSKLYSNQNNFKSSSNNFDVAGSTWFSFGCGWDGVDGSTFVGDWDDSTGYNSGSPFHTGNDRRGLLLCNGKLDWTSHQGTNRSVDWTQYVKTLSRLGQADPTDPTGTSNIPGTTSPRNYTSNPIDSVVMTNRWYHYCLTVYQGWWMIYLNGIPINGWPTSDAYVNGEHGTNTYTGNSQSNIDNGITWSSVPGNNLDKWPQVIRPANNDAYQFPDYTNFTNGGYYGIGVGERTTNSSAIWRPKFLGYIGNYRIYSKCLSVSEVDHNYRSESNRFRTYLNESGRVTPADRTVIQYDSSKSKWVGANPNQNMKNVTEALNDLGSIGNGTTDIDFSLANVVKATVNVSGIYATTFTFSNVPSTGVSSLTLILTDGGSQTVNWPASVTWGGGTAPTLTASGTDVLTFITTDGGTTFYGMTGGLNFS